MTTSPLPTINPKACPLWRVQSNILRLPQQTLSDGAKVVLFQLLFYANADSGEAWPSRQALAESCGGPSTRKIDRHLDELEKAGIIAIRRRGMRQSNVYTFLPHPVFAQEVTVLSTPCPCVLTEPASQRAAVLPVLATCDLTELSTPKIKSSGEKETTIDIRNAIPVPTAPASSFPSLKATEEPVLPERTSIRCYGADVEAPLALRANAWFKSHGGASLFPDINSRQEIIVRLEDGLSALQEARPGKTLEVILDAELYGNSSRWNRLIHAFAGKNKQTCFADLAFELANKGPNTDPGEALRTTKPGTVALVKPSPMEEDPRMAEALRKREEHEQRMQTDPVYAEEQRAKQRAFRASRNGGSHVLSFA